MTEGAEGIFKLLGGYSEHYASKFENQLKGHILGKCYIISGLSRRNMCACVCVSVCTPDNLTGIL